MSDYHAVFELSMPIRWGDMDAFGHWPAGSMTEQAL
jgi:hypothetical protein